MWICFSLDLVWEISYAYACCETRDSTFVHQSYSKLVFKHYWRVSSRNPSKLQCRTIVSVEICSVYDKRSSQSCPRSNKCMDPWVIFNPDFLGVIPKMKVEVRHTNCKSVRSERSISWLNVCWVTRVDVVSKIYELIVLGQWCIWTWSPQR